MFMFTFKYIQNLSHWTKELKQTKDVLNKQRPKHISKRKQKLKYAFDQVKQHIENITQINLGSSGWAYIHMLQFVELGMQLNPKPAYKQIKNYIYSNLECN